MKRILLASLLCGFFALPVWAAPGHEEAREGAEAGKAEAHEDSPAWYMNQDLWKVLNIGLVVYLVIRFSDGAIGRAMRQRSEKIRNELTEARTALDAAEKRFDGVETRFARLQTELQELHEEGKRVAQAEKAKLLSDAQTAAQELVERTKLQIEQETLKAQRDLRQLVAKLVVEKVGNELRQRVETEGDKPFVHSILAKVEALN